MPTSQELIAQRDELLNVASNNSERLRVLRAQMGQAALKGGRAVNQLMGDIRQVEEHNAAISEGITLLESQIVEAEAFEANQRRDDALVAYETGLEKKRQLGDKALAALGGNGNLGAILDEADALAKELYRLRVIIDTIDGKMDNVGTLQEHSRLITHPLDWQVIQAIDPTGLRMRSRRFERQGLAQQALAK